MKVKSESEVAQSCVGLLATPWIAAYQAPPAMGFSRQEYWSGVPLPSPFNCLVALFSHDNNLLIVKFSASGMRVRTLRDGVLDWSDSGPAGLEEIAIGSFKKYLFGTRVPGTVLG